MSTKVMTNGIGCAACLSVGVSWNDNTIGGNSVEHLIIDPEFQAKIPPLSQNEFAKLEESILTDGEVREPLVVWNDVIIDGHHRWAIIQKHPEIPYMVKQMDFIDKWAAVVWMCRNQLGRRNITSQQRDYLIAQEYEAQKNTVTNLGGANQYTPKEVGGGFLHQPKTREVVAKAHGIAEGAVKAAVEFGRGLDEAEKVSPGIKDAVLSGEIKAPKAVISGIRKIPEDERPQILEAIKRGEKVVDLTAFRKGKQEGEIQQIDDDARKHKAFVTMVYTVLKFISDDAELEAVTDAVARSCQGTLLESDLNDLDHAIGLLTNIRNRLIEKGVQCGKKK